MDGCGAGRDRIERAVAQSRRHHLEYDLYLCLDALLTVDAADTGVAQHELEEIRIERDNIVRRLGIVTAD